jgi:hypothetical protein
MCLANLAAGAIPWAEFNSGPGQAIHKPSENHLKAYCFGLMKNSFQSDFGSS